MKEVIGYTADDGKFFESMDEAEEYEAWEALRVVLDEITNEDNVKMIMSIIATVPFEIGRYINANQAAARYREIQASLSSKDQAGREVSDEAILKQQAGLNEPLPDMGSGQQQEEVRLKRAINGLGGGGVDASDVRSGQDMAVGIYTEPAETCTVHSAQNFWESKMG